VETRRFDAGMCEDTRGRAIVIVLKTKTFLIYESGKERRYIQRPPGLDGDVGIMSRPPQHKLPFPPESRTRQRNTNRTQTASTEPTGAEATYATPNTCINTSRSSSAPRRAAATTYLIYPTNHRKTGNRKNRR